MSLFSIQTLPPASPLPSAARPIPSAAAETTWIEASEPFQCTSEVALSQALFHLDGSECLHIAKDTAAVRRLTLSQVVFDSETLLTSRDDEAISPGQPAIPLLDGSRHDVILGYNRHHTQYQSWVTQCLPAIDWCLRLQTERPVSLLLPRLEPWQQTFLDLLGYGATPRIILEPQTRYRIGRLRMAEFLAGVHVHAVCLSLRRTIEHLLAAVPEAFSSDTILYVPGTNRGDDAPSNEAEIINAFRGNGIRIVEPTLMLKERINLFRNAHVVIGPTGQGLTDIVFCRPQTLVWEWMPRYRLNPSFNRLAQAARVDYLGDVFPVSAAAPRHGWQVDPDTIRERMGQIAARLRRQALAVPHPLSAGVPAAHSTRPLPAPTFMPQPAKITGLPHASTEILARFEPLGDDITFALLHGSIRKADVRRLTATHFTGRPQDRLDKLVAALAERFEGVGAPGTVTVTPAVHTAAAGFVAYESRYGLRIAMQRSGSTGDDPDAANGAAHLPSADPAELTRIVEQQLQLDALTLRHALTAGKIWVWHSPTTTDAEQLQSLRQVLREAGPNALLWVRDATLDDPSGKFDVLADDLFRAFIRPAHTPGTLTYDEHKGWVLWTIKRFLLL